MPFREKQKTILVAEGDEDEYLFFVSACYEIDPTVKIVRVSDDVQAMKYLEKWHSEDLPSAILLDYNMQIMSGPDVLREICNDVRFIDMRKFIRGKSYTDIYVMECIHNRATKHFLKPNNYLELLDLVKEVVDAIQ
jgi:CheY-like chemotaxis protein